MKYACIAHARDAFPVALMCRVLGVSRAGYYAWRRRGPSPRAQADQALRGMIRTIHAESRGTYGSPRIQHTLRAEHAVGCGRKRIARLMQDEGLAGVRRPRYRRTTAASAVVPFAPNHLARCFQRPALDRVWVGDITACWTDAGWLYLAAVLDLGSRRVVGWATSARADQMLTRTALSRALAIRQPPPGLLHHTDRGAPYTGADYQALLLQHELVASMSRAGDCWDNAVAESFFATLKTELVARSHWRTRALATAALGHYIDGWYNPRRRHSTLGYVSPADYERQHPAA